MSKEEAIEILSEMRSEYNLFGNEEEATRYHVLSWAIKQMNAEPVRHGHWEWTDDPRTGDFVCSNCLDHNIVRTRYCPNCGAKMDEVEDE